MNWTLAALILVPIAISVGQLLFKLTSQTAGPLSLPGIVSLFLNPWFVAALLLYATATIAWIFVLRGVPVGRAYQFMALTFVAVPLGAWAVFGEVIGPRQVLGIAIILCGIAVTNS